MTPPAAATVPGSGDAPPLLSEHERSVLGVVVYSCTVSSIRHAKDADRAPSMAECGEMLRMSAERVAGLSGALVEDRSARFAADALVPGIDSDPQLAGRLGLWGRRVVGEEIGTLQRMLASFPPLLDGAAGLEDVHAVLSEGAVTRMRSLGLRD